MRTRLKWHNIAAAIAAGALATTVWAAPAVAEPDYPSQDDIADAHQDEETTADTISTIEVQLAENSADLQQAQIEAEQAAEAYNQADADLEAARADADTAEQAAQDAESDLVEAQQQVAQIAMASHRSSGELQQMSMFLSAENFDDALDRASLMQMVGTNADQAVQQMDAAERVANVLRERAEDAVAEAEAAADSLEDAARRADAASLAAQNAVEETASRRDGLVAELADLRDTTVEMEQERQEALEAERQERENAAAATALGTESSAEQDSQQSEGSAAESDNRDDQGSSRSNDRSEPEDQADEETSATEEPDNSGGQDTSGSGNDGAGSSSDDSHAAEPEPDSSSSSGSNDAGSQGSNSSGGSTAPSGVGQAALDWAMTQLGKPYVWGAQGPNSYDCSGLTMQAFQNAGASLPRTTSAQYAATTHVPVDDMRPGDLIFYSSNGKTSGIYHVAIYAGNGMRVHAPAPGQSVEYVPVWWVNVMQYAGRV